MKVALASLLVFALLTIGRATRAESSASLVVIIAPESGGAVAEQLQRDLEGLGLGVLVLAETPQNSSGPAAFERAARGFGAIAAVRLGPEGTAGEIWVTDPVTQRGVVRKLDSAEGVNVEPAEVALGIVELLRAGIVELHSQAPVAPAPPQKALPVAILPKKPAKPSPAVLSLASGAAVDFGLGSVSPSLHATSAAWLRLGACLGLRAFASLPITAERGRVVEGLVEVQTTVLGLGAMCSFDTLRTGRSDRDSEAFFAPRVGLGFATARVDTSGIASLGLRSHSEGAWLAGGFAQVGAALALSRSIRLNLDLTGIGLATPAVIVANRRQVGRWGAPGGLLAVSVEALAR